MLNIPADKYVLFNQLISLMKVSYTHPSWKNGATSLVFVHFMYVYSAVQLSQPWSIGQHHLYAMQTPSISLYYRYRFLANPLVATEVDDTSIVTQRPKK